MIFKPTHPIVNRATGPIVSRRVPLLAEGSRGVIFEIDWFYWGQSQKRVYFDMDRVQLQLGVLFEMLTSSSGAAHLSLLVGLVQLNQLLQHHVCGHVHRPLCLLMCLGCLI